MTFTKGHQRYGGRKRGGRNKLVVDVRQALLGAGAELGGKGGLQAFFVDVGKRDPRTLAGWIAALVPRPATNRVDEDGHPPGTTVTTINIVGVPSGTYVDQETYLQSAYGDMPLLELEAAEGVANDDTDEPDNAA